MDLQFLENILKSIKAEKIKQKNARALKAYQTRTQKNPDAFREMGIKGGKAGGRILCR